MKKAIIGLLSLFSLVSCGKSDVSYIPYVAVNFQAPLSDPRLSKLNSPGGAVIVNGYGVAGLVLYREPDGSFAAYDRCSSYEPEKKCAVNIDDTGFTVTDPCSGSKFSLSDGSPVKAPASRSLKAYSVNVSNFVIFVSN
ncbi:hypothetical protein MUY27_16270 [Mucilaginibacter sp. RS28]|uniref:Rieske domain-containing protein n=1 Tax=Mucilaginibacter straminoryzae TaxID=2932774 RepID=A0A9X2BAZ1_9SPHI|nr:hypothetical protein [Mucilaginibacter straminoryzae]MCJ8211275.1 hypothetical protein [Mucilaginibacter straminoryzae]